MLAVEAPYCVNGFLKVEREGYHAASEQVSLTQDQDVSVLLEKYQPKKLAFTLLTEEGPHALRSDEQVLLQLDETAKRYGTAVLYPETTTINLIPGTYDVRAYVVMNSSQGITVAGTTLKNCVDVPKQGVLGVLGITEEKCMESKLPSAVLYQVFTGGAAFTWSVTGEDLAQGDTVTFYLKDVGVPQKADELTRLASDLPKISKNLPRPEVGNAR